MDKKIPKREYNNRTVYDCSNNNFTEECFSPYLNLTPITIDDRPQLGKRYRYTTDMLLSIIYIASGKYVSTLTTPYDSSQLIILTSDDTNHFHAMKKYEPYCGRVKIGYFSMKRDKKRKTRLCCSKFSDKDKNLLLS